MKYHLAILTTTINPDTITELVQAAAATANQAAVEIVCVTATVGCLDMPIIAQRLFQKKDVDGLVVLGAVALGETKHDELVVNNMTQAIIQLSLQFDKPVGFGVIGPGAVAAQFKTRTTEYAVRAVEAVVRNLQLLQELA
jgi:6,7-dimethyl-8-ribityllumazine synthase